MIRVILPTYLTRLANVEREVQVEVVGQATYASLLDALEAAYPMLQGTIREHDTHQRRAYIRFFASGEDFSHQPMEAPLPPTVVEGREPLRIVGAMSGG